MPNGYKLLVGLTEIDSASSYYARNLPGFDGRRGCEGCARDIERMDRLTHYLGYQSITQEPLFNERATRANVEGALNLMLRSDALKDGDILLVYLTCHGQVIDFAPDTAPETNSERSRLQQLRESRSSVLRFINAFLLYDRPILNLEIMNLLVQISRLAMCTPAKEIRMVTVFDCCHAGLSGNFYLELRSFAHQMIQQLALSSPLVLEYLQAPRLQTRSERTETIEGYVKEALETLILPPGVVHLAASRNETTALGGRNGSLFTRRFCDALSEGGFLKTYGQIVETLKAMLPTTHPPGLERWPSGNSTSRKAPHFSENEHTLSIG